MVNFQEQVTLHEETVQKLAEGEVKIPRQRRKKPEQPESSPVRVLRKSDRIADKLFADVDARVYDKALELAADNWRRLEKIDNQTIIVHNNEVH
jgi:hypothetical protein